MKAMQKRNYYLRLILPVSLTVVVLVTGFFLLARSVILELSRDRMTFKSDNYADYIKTWADKTLGELEIYKDELNREGDLNESAFDILSTSYGTHSEYPYGLYWGDEYANFYDASGWDPGPDYIPKSRTWYIDGLKSSDFIFGEPYIDARTDKPCVSASVKMNIGEAESVLAADIYFDYVADVAKRIAAQEIDRAFFVSAKNRMIVADADITQTGKTLSGTIYNPLYRGISELLDENFLGFTYVEYGKETYCVNIDRIDELDWYFITCMRESTMLTSLRKITVYMVLFAIFSCVLLVFLMNRATGAFNKADKASKVDTLTGLLNRDGFGAAVKTALKNLPNQGAMIMIDVDNFKMVNDELGHGEGDEFLKEFSAMLAEFFNRGKDITARLGGDEFAVFVGRNVDKEDVDAMLGIFSKQFHKRFDFKYRDQRLSVSIGACFAGVDGSTLNEIYENADKALYEAKNTGKDKYIIR